VEQEIKDAIKQSIQQKSIFYLRAGSLNLNFQAIGYKLEENTLLLRNPFPRGMVSQAMECKDFSLQVDMIQFDVQEITPQGKMLGINCQNAAFRKEVRSSERFAFNFEEQVYLETTNPRDQKTKLKKQILDMSAGGLSFVTFSESKLFTREQKVPNITVFIDGEPYKKSDGEVAYQNNFIDLQGNLKKQIGIKFIEQK